MPIGGSSGGVLPGVGGGSSMGGFCGLRSGGLIGDFLGISGGSIGGVGSGYGGGISGGGSGSRIGDLPRISSPNFCIRHSFLNHGLQKQQVMCHSKKVSDINKHKKIFRGYIKCRDLVTDIVEVYSYISSKDSSSNEYVIVSVKKTTRLWSYSCSNYS